MSKAEENTDLYTTWKPNCQMTPTADDIIGGRWSGLREMADAVNRYDCTLIMIDLGIIFGRMKLHEKI